MTNYSYFALPLVYLQTMAASVRGATRRVGYNDNVSPRGLIDRIEKEGKVSPRAIATLRRRQAAHENCFENMGFFAAAVVAGNSVGLSSTYMNTISFGYFAIRCLYIYLYIKVTQQKYSWLRTAAFWASNFCFLTTFVKAGLKLSQQTSIA